MPTLNLLILGKGNVGSTLINQIISLEKYQSKIKVIAIANSQKALFSPKGLSENWADQFEKTATAYSIEKLVRNIQKEGLLNLVAVDVTASQETVEKYNFLIENNFHLVTANKKANANHQNFYLELRKTLKKYNKQFLYETNVGAGLPIVHPLKNLIQSGERITKINGVFSGTLSYIFNRFANTETPFSEIVAQAKRNGLTEPNPIEDLQGLDVARKLLILAREIGLEKELEDVEINSFIPNAISESELPQLDIEFKNKKLAQKEGFVLKHIGELDVEKNILTIGLQSVPENSPIGQLKGADNIIQIFSENYNEHPIVIQGAGAGKEVTARGVLGDIFRLYNLLKFNQLQSSSTFSLEKIA